DLVGPVDHRRGGDLAGRQGALELGEADRLAPRATPEHRGGEGENEKPEDDVEGGAARESFHGGGPFGGPFRLPVTPALRTRRHRGGSGSARRHRGRSPRRSGRGCESPRSGGRGRPAGGLPSRAERTPRDWRAGGRAGSGAGRRG